MTTEKTLAEYFAKENLASKGLTYDTTMSQRIYELTAVKPDVKTMWCVRLLDEKDMHFSLTCVAQISQLALDKGFTKCVLYTD